VATDNTEDWFVTDQGELGEPVIAPFVIKA
jgi:hypothetical protein